MEEPFDSQMLRYAEEHILMLLSLHSIDGPHLRTRQSVSRELWPHIAEQAIMNLLANGSVVEKGQVLEITKVGRAKF